jgi:sugar phosphate isomerase/epimerase
MNTREVHGLIEKSALAVAAVGTNPAMSQDGLTLLNPDKEIRARAVDRVIEMIDFAAPYGAPVCIGKFRGNLWKGQEEAAMTELTSAFSKICDHGAKKQVPIMLEPQHKGNINNLNTAGEAAAWIDERGFSNLGILYDTFHGELAEVSTAASIIAAKGKLGFVHCSDSDRLPPGTGRIHLADAFAVLKAIGYAGYVSMEINQKPDSLTAAELAYKTVRYILDYVV